MTLMVTNRFVVRAAPNSHKSGQELARARAKEARPFKESAAKRVREARPKEGVKAPPKREKQLYFGLRSCCRHVPAVTTVDSHMRERGGA